MNKSAGQVVNGDFKEVFPCFFFIQEGITNFGEIISKRQCIKKFHIPRCSRVVLDASCIAPDFVRLPPYGPNGQRQARRSGDRSTQ